MSYDAGMGSPRPEPLAMHDRAIDNLRYIRKTLERAGSFTAVPGIGGMLMGSTALAAAWVADRQSSAAAWLLVWITEGLVALVVGVAGAWLKSRRVKMPLLSGPCPEGVASAS